MARMFSEYGELYLERFVIIAYSMNEGEVIKVFILPRIDGHPTEFVCIMRQLQEKGV